MTSLSVRPEMAGDRDAISRVVVAAFGQPDEARLVDRLRHEGHLQAASVATVGGAVIGYAALSKARVGPANALVLAPVAVDPALQNQGVGIAVVSHLLEHVEAPVVVTGDPDYYRRFGFVDARIVGVTDLTFAPPPGVLQILSRGSAPTGAIEYPAPFLDLG